MTTPTDTTTTNAVAVVPPQTKLPVLAGNRGLQLNSLDDYWRLATCIAKSGLAPKGIDTPEAIVVAMQLGAEVGLPPLAAVQQISVINGRPSIFGDAQLGVCRDTKELEKFEEWFEVDGKRITRTPSEFVDGTAAVCLVKRRGYPESQDSFSVRDAKRANLWGKTGPWSQYPARMLRFRARSFLLRDQFGDALRGLRTPEENLDAGAIDISARPAPEPAVQIFHTPTDNPPPPDVTPGESPKPSGADIPTASAAVPEASLPPDEPETVPAWKQLAQVVEGAGFEFPDFVGWAGKSGQLPTEADALTSWDSIPEATAIRLLKARKGMLGQLRLFKGQK